MSVKMSFGSSLKDFSRDVAKFSKQTQKEVEDIIAKTTKEVARDARIRTPVDTGRLARAWKFKVKGLDGEIFNPVPYAIFIEFGTIFIAPFHMLTMALRRGQNRLKRKLKALERKMPRKF